MSRRLSEEFMDSLMNGELQTTLKLVRDDASLDLELRGNEVMVYFRGLKLLTISEKNGTYNFETLDSKYGRRKNGNDIVLPQWDINNQRDYLMRAKDVIDTYDMRNSWEDEIKQMVVRENNTSVNAMDTDFYVIDTEYQNHDSNRFDIVALHLDSTRPARMKAEANIAVIEIKQGIKQIQTTNQNPGIRRHLEDFKSHVANTKQKSLFISEMRDLFIQKYQLGLIEGLTENTISRLTIKDNVVFYVLLANYKKASTALLSELKTVQGECNFLTSFFSGYGLYTHSIKSKEEVVNLLKV